MNKILFIISLLLLSLNTYAQNQNSTNTKSASVHGIWVFPDSMDVHFPILFLHSDNTFELDNYADEHEKGDSSIFGTWQKTPNAITLTFEECMCCQFSGGDIVQMDFFAADSTGLDVTFWKKRVLLKPWIKDK
ncbi:hypothetical protein KAR48_15635 [bacterium]|nr:hypothetical protein [bacterium]